MKSALVVLSGGQDSATCAAWAHAKFGEIKCLTFDYGQRHRKELDAAKRIAALFNASHEILEIPALMHNASSSLTNPNIGTSDVDAETGLPKSFVPGRNLVFLTQAASLALSCGIHDVVTGVCQTDFFGYPDCRRNTIDALQLAINLGNENLTRACSLNIHTPLMYLSKAETVLLAKDLPNGLAAVKQSWTCYENGEKQCGDCPACRLRAAGFKESGIEDPGL